MKNKIGWCDMTWNPVWGCKNHCEYCYARKINKRFWAKMIETESDYHHKIHQDWVMTGNQLRDLHDFFPTWFESQFNKKFPKKPQRIFVGSMSEIYYWREEWIERVIEKIKQYPQHTFQFLTKFPSVYDKWVFPENCWLGVTITKGNDIRKNSLYHLNNSHLWKTTYISFEPLLEKIDLDNYYDSGNIDWVIIGAETGNRKGKVIPEGSWIDDIVCYCKNNNIPIYIKDNLSKYYDEFRGYKQFPKERRKL